MVEQRGGVVQDVAVELAEGDDELGGVAQWVVDGDEVCGEVGAGTPEDLANKHISWARNAVVRVYVRQ